MGKSKMAMFLSVAVVLASYAILATKGLNYGVDFAGGTVVQVKYATTAPINKMRKAPKGNELFASASISEFGSPDEVVIRMKTSSGNVTRDIGDISRELLAGSGEFEIRRVDIVGPKVGSELREKGLMAMLLAIIGILIYVSFRFEWRFAVASVFALVHDVSIAMGMLVIFEVDVNLDILAALLTILGYSLNDTIIVFDRIRENIKIVETIDKLPSLFNKSINETLSRTILTSVTTLIVLFALYFLGGEIIHNFAFAMIVGVLVGTYSSIFVASPIVLVANKR